MRKLIITIGATATGTAAVLAYQPLIERTARAVAATAEDAADRPSQAGNSLSLGQGEVHPAGPERAWTRGPQIPTAAGPVQVKVSIEDGVIRDVQLLQGPHGSRHSAWLTRRASMILRVDVLNAQSADVDMISGATYTSAGYLQSLQAALDAAEGR